MSHVTSDRAVQWNVVRRTGSLLNRESVPAIRGQFDENGAQFKRDFPVWAPEGKKAVKLVCSATYFFSTKANKTRYNATDWGHSIQ